MPRRARSAAGWRLRARHQHQAYLSFLREMDEAVPFVPDIHGVADNDAIHHHPMTKAQRAGQPRSHRCPIPTDSPWPNQSERCFSLFTAKPIRRGSFTSVKPPVPRTDHFVAADNANWQPLEWQACRAVAHARADR